MWFRELILFAMSFVRTLFFVAPGLVALDTVPDDVATLLKLNPLSGIFEGYRDGTSLRPCARGVGGRLIPLAFSVGLIVVFGPLYARRAARSSRRWSNERRRSRRPAPACASSSTAISGP